jgi:flavin reductase (DIM6/NTAB) family NADH-FMN oxidoreductase RutF
MTDAIRVDPSHFRSVLAHLPTGVSVITAHGANGPVGMTANSVTSVSLDPPLMLFCPARTSMTWPELREAGACCINVLAGHHEGVTRRFAMKDVDRFDGIAYVDRSCGPALCDALAWIECRVEDEHIAGDHTIVVARVVEIEAAPKLGDPLVFFRGTYGSFRGAGS